MIPSVLSRPSSSSPRPSSSPYTCWLCWPRSGAGWAGTCEEAMRTGHPGIRYVPRVGWSISTMTSRLFRCGSWVSSSVSMTALQGTPAPPRIRIASCFVWRHVQSASMRSTSSWFSVRVAGRELPGERDAAVVDDRVLHRDLDALALPGLGALVERGQDADRGVQARARVSDRGPRLEWDPVALAGQADRPAGRLRDGVERQEVAVRPVLREPLDLDVDELRVDLLDLVVAEAEALDHAGRKVLDEDVPLLDQAPQHLLALGLAEVQRHGPLVRVQQQEVPGVEARHVRGRVPPLLALARAFDLDHVRPQPGQALGARGASLELRQIDDADTFECCCHGQPPMRPSLDPRRLGSA